MNTSLRRIHQLLLDKGIPFVRYRLPGNTKAITLVSFNPVSLAGFNYLANNQDEGFVFAPFNVDKQHPICFLKADEILDEESDMQSIEKRIDVFPDRDIHVLPDIESTSKLDYSAAFEVYMSKLKSDSLNKAILSRIILKPKAEQSVFSLFNRISEKYSNAFTYLIFLPSGEMWMGATPELLLSQDKSGLQTMALAGTQVLNNRLLSDVTWKNKEIEEQAYVRNYVENVLSTSSEEVEVSETYSAKAGNLVHLRTDFKVKQAFDRAQAIAITGKLHPTPAVCGIPLEESRALILDVEKHNRAYYTGFLGPVKSTSLSLFVNLRCMQVLPQQYALYVGGGITRDSEMDKEWTETEEKAQTLLSVIDSSQ